MMIKIILSVLITVFLNLELQRMSVEANCCCPQPPIIIQPPPALHKICQVPCCCGGGGGGRRRRSLISAIDRRQNSKSAIISRVNGGEKKNNHNCGMCPPLPKAINSTISGGSTNCSHPIPKEIKNIHKQKKQIKKDH
uniref:Secreted protein n=1 Tax=Meloidogyne hapla TaxID=6305 RepID=A0A1I8BLM9_MELHA